MDEPSFETASPTPPRSKKTVAQDMLPPYSSEAEQGVLGCIILDPNTVIPLCIERLLAGSDSFYDLRHQTIYDALLEMYDARTPIDVITLRQRLTDSKEIDQVGGFTYITSLPDTVPSASNVEYYTSIVWDKYLLRRTLRTCTEIVYEVYTCNGDVGEFIDGVERKMLRISERRRSLAEVTTRQLVQQAINEIESIWNRQGAISGISTGFSDIDRLTDGFHQGEMIVLAARPGCGKTSLLMNILEHITLKLNLPAGMFSLEMTGQQLMTRALSSYARVNLRMVRDGILAERDFPKLGSAAAAWSKAPLYLDDRGGLSLMEVRAKARRWHQQHGIKVLGIDYLQLMTNQGSTRRFESRQQEITEISAGIKNLAKELNIPIIALSQLNRDIEKDKGFRKPRLSDLRESGSIEQDADVVCFLYSKAKEGDYNKQAAPIDFLIAKQRNGDRDVVVPLTFLKAYTRFEQAAKVTEEDVPANRAQNDP